LKRMVKVFGWVQGVCENAQQTTPQPETLTALLRRVNRQAGLNPKPIRISESEKPAQAQGRPDCR
jgi:hypothetical protein